MKHKLVDLSKFNLPSQYLRYILDRDLQERLKVRYKLEGNVRIVKTTLSVCPVCTKVINAVVYEEDNAIWMRKYCPEHGYFTDLYWGDAEMYYYYIQWDRVNYLGCGVTNPNTDWKYYREHKGCPFACGLCPIHRSNTILAIIDVTNRCNMRCPICFANAAVSGYVYEPSLEEIDSMLRVLRSEKPWAPNAIQFSGGEPTLRNDLPEMIRLAKKYGFDHVEVNTNGIRLAYDIDYYKALMEAGMSTIYLQCDTLNENNDKILRYRKYDPKAYVKTRLKVIENARKIGHKSVVLVVTAAKEFNDKDLGGIVKFAIENRDVVRWVNIQPIAFAGRAREYSKEELRRLRITIPDVIIEIEKQTNGVISRWDWRPVNWPVAFAKALEVVTGKEKPLFTNNPVCGASTFIYYDEDEKKAIPITKLVDVDAFEKLSWEVYNTATKRGLWKHLAKVKLLKLIKYVKHKTVKNLLLEVILKRDYAALRDFMFNVVGLGIMHFMDVFNYDLQRVRRCTIHYATPDGRIIPFCTLNNFHREKIERKYSMSVREWLSRHPGKTVTSYA